MQNETINSALLREFEGLDVKIVNILLKYDILKIDTLTSKKESDLLMFRNMGPHNISLIRKWLNDKGLDLAPEFTSLSINLSDCKDLYNPVITILQKNRIYTLEDLISKTEDNIFELKGMCQFHFFILMKWLQKYHLSLS